MNAGKDGEFRIAADALKVSFDKKGGDIFLNFVEILHTEKPGISSLSDISNSVKEMKDLSPLLPDKIWQ